MRRIGILIAPVVAMLALAPVSARAQSDAGTVPGAGVPPAPFPSTAAGATSSRPFTGLFGGGSVADRRQSLDLTASLYAAYAREVLLDSPPGVTDAQLTGPTTYSGAGASLSYARNWDRASVGAFAGGGLAYGLEGDDQSKQWTDRWSVGAHGGYHKPIDARTRFSASAATTYSPYQQLGAFQFGPGNINPLPNDPGLDFVVARDPVVTTSATGALSRDLTRRSSLETYYNLFGRTFLDEASPRADQYDNLFGARYRLRLNRYLGLRAGYAYRLTSYGGQPSTGRHEFDIGLDGGYGFGKSYALTRRTSFSFNVNPSLFLGERYTVENGAGELEQINDPTVRFFLGGTADLIHTMGVTWAARVGYRRSANYEVGFDRPLLSDTAFTSLNGLITRRVDFSAALYYTRGSVGFTGSNNGYDTAHARVGLRAALTRLLAAYAQYFYYHYNFQSEVVLPTGLPPRLDREGASAGLTLWLPLL